MQTVDFTGVTLPFSVSDLLGTAMDLLGLLGPFVLLGLAVMFTPKLIGVIRNAAASRGTK